MASVYKKGVKLYISWWDNNMQKTKNKSTGLIDTKENRKRVEEAAKKLQEKLDKEKEESDRLGLVKVTLNLAIENFLKVNSRKNKSTIVEYEAFFRRLRAHFDGNLNCNQLNKVTVEEWLNNHINILPLQRNSLYTIVKNLKKFLNFLFEYNYVPQFILNKDSLTRPEVKPIRIFSEEDMKKIFNGLSSKNSNFKTLLYTLFYSGLRPSDIYKLQVEQIDLRNKRFCYHSEKTDDELMVPIYKKLLPVLKDRINEVKSGPIFEYETVNNIGKAFRRYMKQIGINKKGYDLRTFRKSFISYAYDSQIDLATVSKLVGHKSITTTAKYYNKINISRKTDELNKLRIKGLK